MSTATMRVLSYNIRFGGTGREAQIAEVIRAADPDVVILQEASDPMVVERLAELTSMTEWGARARYSIGFLSRNPLEGHEWHHPRGSRHAFLELVMPEDRGRLYGLHLEPWFSNWNEKRRAREMRRLLESIKEHQHGFHIIAGDFNALAPGARLDVSNFPLWIQAMVWLSGRDIARHTIQSLHEAKYADAWHLHHDGDPGFTFPVWKPHVRLDYVFTPDRYGARVTRCDVLYDAPQVKTASDHFPLLVEIDLAQPTPQKLETL